jgi:hypothetical protein
MYTYEQKLPTHQSDTQYYTHKTFFAILYLLKTEKCHHKCQNHFQNMKLATGWQLCDSISDNFKLFELHGSIMQTNKNLSS